MNKEVKKPLSVERQEFIEDITALINRAKLPAFVIEYILKDLYLEAKEIARKTYEIEKESYEELLRK